MYGPDFIIIGAMKCATSTLHDQLAAQPGIAMTTPKEPCFFSDDAMWDRGLAWYQSLFERLPAGDRLGESSTHYTKLPTHPRTVERMQATLPEHTRFIYVMRHPIDRLVSQYVHEWTQRVVNGSIDEAVRSLPGLVEYGEYARQLEPYLEAFGHERVLPVFFDRLVADPQGTLERVCTFLEYERQPRWDEELSQRNASAQRLRRSAWRDVVVECPPVRLIRRALVPQGLRNWIKGFWTMTQRPELSVELQRELEARYDEDLARLGEWLHVHLDCATFHEVAGAHDPTWSPSRVPARNEAAEVGA